MTDETTGAPEQAMVDSIRWDAESQARLLVENAEGVARTELENASREAEVALTESRARAERDAAKLKARSLANARLEARRILMRARDEGVRNVLTLVERSLKDIKSDPARYRRALVYLMSEAIEGVAEKNVAITLGAADRGLVDDVLMDEVKSRTNQRLGFDIEADLRFDDGDLGGGCVAASLGGRVRLDNTFARRLTEAKTHIGPSIIDEIGKSRE
ncbi:MAG: hypothetical protein HZB26_13525 [Candidatus Hydrogenedentes bacterium]|nr:hypothetical protein [Candidatus Hydrogenedentota bacterium]